MNGCCMTNADSSGHDLTCRSYWPCGCRKDSRVKRHTHTYTNALLDDHLPCFDQRPPTCPNCGLRHAKGCVDE